MKKVFKPQIPGPCCVKKKFVTIKFKSVEEILRCCDSNRTLETETYYHLTVCLSLFSSQRCIIRQYNRFSFYYIQNNQAVRKCYQLRLNNFVHNNRGTTLYQGEFKQTNPARKLQIFSITANNQIVNKELRIWYF